MHQQRPRRRSVTPRPAIQGPRIAKSLLHLLLVLVATLSLAQALRAEDPLVAQAPPYAEPGDDSARYTAETIASGLDHPCSPTIRPGVYEDGPRLYLSESGAGRVLRHSGGDPGQTHPAITDIPVAPLGDEPAFRVGPLGLEFITPSKLAVGTGGLGPGKDVVRVYALPDDDATLAFDAAEHAVGPVAPSARSAAGPAVFLSLAKIEDQIEKALFVVSAGDAAKGWLLKANLTANRLSDLQPFIATAEVTGVASPSAATINPKPRAHYLLVAQAGQRDESRDSTVTFYSPVSGKVTLHLRSGLHDISGLAYSPSGDLYASDLAWHDAGAGGVYRLEAAEVDGQQSCRAVKVAAVNRPTGLAFAPDGTLYVTALGKEANDSREPEGVLLRITPGPGTPKL